MNSNPIYIYLPANVDISGFPDNPHEPFDVTPPFAIEVSWIFFLFLRNQGLNAQVCSSIPKTGMLIIHKMHEKKFFWNPELFVVSMQWDHKRDDRAQVHLVSNHYKTSSSALGLLDWITFPGRQYFLQPPLHSVLIQRNASRGDAFENVAFIGAKKNLDSALGGKSFQEQVADLGIKFEIIDDPEKMNDYTNIDAILAVRKFGKIIKHKPAPKLINAWRAGVPAVLGLEVGYRELRESEVDYLEVNSLEDVVAAIKKLKDNPEFRREMIRNGLKKSEHYTPLENESQWGVLFRDHILADYSKWKGRSRAGQYLFLWVRWMRHASRITFYCILYRILKVKPRV